MSLRDGSGRTFRERMADEARERREMRDGNLRLRILQVLASDPGYSHNEIVLRKALIMAGHEITKPELRKHLRWLDERGLALYEVIAVGIARITPEGARAAAGEVDVDGVEVPLPE